MALASCTCSPRRRSRDKLVRFAPPLGSNGLDCLHEKPSAPCVALPLATYHNEHVGGDPDTRDAAKDRWLQGALEEYRSLREESLQGLRAQQLGVQLGVTLLAALIGVGVGVADQLTRAVLLDVAVPVLAIFLTILWQGELERSVRVGHYLTERERVISKVGSLPRRPPPMEWENWLSRNPHVLLVRYYNAQFRIIVALALGSAVVGVIGLLGQGRWGFASLFGTGALGLLLASSNLYRSNYSWLMQLRSPVPAGLVAFSFGGRRQASGPSPVNLQLAQIANSLRSSCPSMAAVAAQAEVAAHLEFKENESSLVIGHSNAGYLDSVEVWAQAAAFFRHAGITHVIAVAHPFLHVQYIRWLIRRDGFEVVPVHIPRLGFDRSGHNIHWWTRGHLRLIIYSVLRPFLRVIRHGRLHTGP